MKKSFFTELASYIKRLRESQRNLDAKSLKAIVLEEETRRLEQLLDQLLSRRLEKLWIQASAAESDNVESAEKQAHRALLDSFRDYDGLKHDVMQGREPSTSRAKERRPVLVRFVKAVPSIIGVDLKTHGPFHSEDVARLPQENAESLIRQGAAVEIRITHQGNE